MWYLHIHLDQFTKNYTLTTKREAADNKTGGISSTGKCGIFRLKGQGDLKRQENRAVIARRGAASAGLFSSRN